MSKVIERLETQGQTWTNVTLYKSLDEVRNAGLSFMHEDKEGTFFGAVSNEGSTLDKVGFVPYKGYYPDYLKLARDSEPAVIQEHDKAFTAEIDHVNVTVLDGRLSEAEIKAYIDRAREKFPDKLVKAMTISVVDSNHVDIEYHHDTTPFQRLRRVTGYLADEHRTNNAKRSEIKDRVKHDISPTMDFEDVYIDNEEENSEEEAVSEEEQPAEKEQPAEDDEVPALVQSM